MRKEDEMLDVKEFFRSVKNDRLLMLDAKEFFSMGTQGGNFCLNSHVLKMIQMPRPK